ncbi:hypothetical protein [Sediminitomix flava]|uniref:Uncharacterized protein n=1 Tax=Sediminitomix flava TaxID=379075 RepID=A0A315ZJY1_SEDFL|nr:hypothetical protein [Sediminitomix flava]PWJ44994.1 hypothetical protein BC781_1011392 [Sediminitomix flava]
MESAYIREIIREQREQDDYSKQLDLIVRQQDYLPPPTLKQEERLLIIYTKIYRLSLDKGFELPYYDIWSFILMQCAWREYISRDEQNFDATFRRILNNSFDNWQRKADSL